MKNKLIFTLLALSLCMGAHSSDFKDEVIFSSGTACLGGCPVYRFYYFSNGSYVFEGEQFTKVVGIRRGVIDPSSFKQLIALLKVSNFYELEAHYGWGNRGACKELRTDYPFITTRHQARTGIYEVHHYTGCTGFKGENQLEQVENKIYELLVKENLIEKL